MKLTDEQLRVLLEHPGYGGGIWAPAMVETIIIGNESGASGAGSLEEYISAILNPAPHPLPANDKVQAKSQFLQFIARLNLFMKDKDPKWFYPKSALNYADRVEINKDWANEGRVHLLDIRPLPRKTESARDFEYEGIDMKSYLSAFNNFDCEAPGDYGPMVACRKNALKTQIERYHNLRYIIAPGAMQMKLAFFENLFEGVKFEEALPGFYTARYQMGTLQFMLVVCKFFNSRNGLGLGGLRTLATIIADFETNDK